MPRALLPIAAVLVAAAALAGCKSQGPDRAMARFYGDAAAHAQAIARPPTAGARTRSTRGEAEPVPAPQTASRPDPAAALPGPLPGPLPAPLPKVDANPERFIGAAPATLDAELGRPALVRAEGPARVWQYRGPACVLDLVLYPGADGPSVRHLEARDPESAEPRDTAGCLETLLQRRAVAATG